MLVDVGDPPTTIENNEADLVVSPTNMTIATGSTASANGPLTDIDKNTVAFDDLNAALTDNDYFSGISSSFNSDGSTDNGKCNYG